MSFQQTLEHLRSLKLHAMAQALDDQRSNVAAQELSFDERIALVVDRQVHDREKRRIHRLERSSNLKSSACPEEIDYHTPRGLDRQLMLTLLTCDWIQKSLSVILTGPTGTGKTWLGNAVGRQAIRKGFSVRCERLKRLLENIEVAYLDGSFRKLRAEIAKIDLLIIDDWGLASFSSRGRQELLEIIEDREERGSLLVTSQLPVEKWHDYINDVTYADATLDRFVHKSYRLELYGESMRKQYAPSLTPKEA